MIADTNTCPVADADTAPLFSAPYAPPDEAIAASLLDEAARASGAERRIDGYARRLVEGIRARAGGLGGIEDFLHAYSLSTKEGLALMVLAEALLRVPDAATADRLIEDKLRPANGRRNMSNRARSWSPPRPGRSALPRASFTPARPQIRFWKVSSNALAFPPCARPRARRCGSWPRISCSDRPSRRRSSAPARNERCAIHSTCWGRARARGRTRSVISRPTPMRLRRSPRMPMTRTVPPFQSSFPPCIRASRRYRAIWF